MDQTTNSLNWFEIPAVDIGRAKTFYESIFDIQMQEHEHEWRPDGFFSLGSRLWKSYRLPGTKREP